MSSTNKTTNKELSQFIGSDKPSFLTDYNNDMNKIDLALKANEDLALSADGKGASALSGLGALNSRVGLVELEVDNLNTLETRTTAIENALPTKANAESPIITGTMNLQDGKLQFPSNQLPSSNVNVLDDYEEGTFTPRIEGSNVVGIGSYSIQLGEYTKIGDTVFFSLYILCNSHTGSGELILQGLPYVSNNLINKVVNIFTNNLIMSANKFPTAQIGAGTTKIIINQSEFGTTTSDSIPLQNSALVLAISGHYKV